MISTVSPIASASTVNMDAISDILNFMLRPSFISIYVNPTNSLPSLFEQSVAKRLLVLIFPWKIFFNSLL
jgi:hypothetical protein